MKDGGAYGALGEGALGRFELELEAERIEGGGSGSQLAAGLAGQGSAGHQAPIRRLGRVVASGDACAATDLLGEPAHRVQEVHVVASEVVHVALASIRTRVREWVARF